MQTHTGQNWSKLYYTQKPLPPKDRSSKQNQKKQFEEIKEECENWKAEVVRLKSDVEKLKQENRLLKKIFKAQGMIVNQWLSDKAPEGAVQEGGGVCFAKWPPKEK